MASPTPPSKVITFADFQSAQPSTPLPATSLDSQIAELIRSCTEIIDFLNLIQRTDGALANQTVGEPQLQPGLLQTIIDDLTTQIAPLQSQLDQMQSSIDVSTAQADSAAASAQTNAADANAARQAAEQVLATIQQIENQLPDYVAQAQQSQQLATQAQTSFQQAEARAEFYENSAYLWAEYMAGPVVNLNDPSVYPASVDDGLWSAKYWATLAADDANNAQTALKDFYTYYYGEWDPLDPTPGMPDDGTGNPEFDPNGNSPVLGAMYFNTLEDALKVNTSSGWQPYGASSDAIVFVGDNPPPSPSQGTYWFKSDVGVLYIYYEDPNSSQWVGVSAGNLDLRGIITDPSNAIVVNHTTHLNAKVFCQDPIATTVTVPTYNDPVRAFKVGQLTSFIQDSPGKVTISPEGGVTIKSPDNMLATRVQNSEIKLTYLGNDNWSLEGDLV